VTAPDPLDALLADLPTPSGEACLPHDAARTAVQAIVRMASVRPNSSAAVYAYTDLAEALGPERIDTLARFLAPPPGAA